MVPLSRRNSPCSVSPALWKTYADVDVGASEGICPSVFFYFFFFAFFFVAFLAAFFGAAFFFAAFFFCGPLL